MVSQNLSVLCDAREKRRTLNVPLMEGSHNVKTRKEGILLGSCIVAAQISGLPAPSSRDAAFAAKDHVLGLEWVECMLPLIRCMMGSECPGLGAECSGQQSTDKGEPR